MPRFTTTIEADPSEGLHNPTPGDILLEDFIKPIGMSQAALAAAIGVSTRTVGSVVHGKRRMTADLDLRLGRYWGMSDGFWLRLQADHDLMEQRRKMGAELGKIVPRAA